MDFCLAVPRAEGKLLPSPADIGSLLRRFRHLIELERLLLGQAAAQKTLLHDVVDFLVEYLFHIHSSLSFAAAAFRRIAIPPSERTPKRAPSTEGPPTSPALSTKTSRVRRGPPILCSQTPYGSSEDQDQGRPSRFRSCRRAGSSQPQPSCGFHCRRAFSPQA